MYIFLALRTIQQALQLTKQVTNLTQATGEYILYSGSICPPPPSFVYNFPIFYLLISYFKLTLYTLKLYQTFPVSFWISLNAKVYPLLCYNLIAIGLMKIFI